jgi:serine/threonine protein kinase/Flp pilus assembly protein TadD
MRPESPERLGDFELIRELGRGGMGIVYEARQVSLNRKVALKVLAGGLGLTSKAVQRFRREAQAAAKLHHTNIVPIYATGEEDGTHFYAMELIDGPSLEQVVKHLKASRERQRPEDSSPGQTPVADAPGSPNLEVTAAHLEVTGPAVADSAASQTLSSSSLSSGTHYFDTVARMIAEVADALGYAHKNGVIHRDIKPSNLLLSPDGRLSINDFGLARVLEQAGMTVSGEFVGTPAYMSPEQIAAGRIPLDHRTDIYSLGATLYELLTLERPHTGQSREQVLAQIVHKEPKAPRQIRKKVPVDLETICLKCLEKDPDRRYQTAGDLAEDLRRYVNRFAISAKRAGPVQRLAKWTRRHPGLAIGLLFVFLAILTSTFFGYQMWVQEQERLAERCQAALEQALVLTLATDFDRADMAVADAERLGASTGQLRMLQGQIALFRFEDDSAVRHLEQAVRLEPQSVAARALLAWAYLSAGSTNNDYEKAVDELKKLEPVTAEDYLFKGRIEAVTDPERGLNSLQEAIRRRSSPLAYVIRAAVRTDRASVTNDPALAESAIADVAFTRTLLAENPLALDTSAYAHLVAAAAYRATGQEEKARAAQIQGEKDSLALARFVDRIPGIAFKCAFCLQLVGQENTAFEVLRRAHEQKATSAIRHALACGLYRRGQYAEAVAVLKEARTPAPKDSFQDCIQAYILPELPGGQERALAIVEEIAAERPKAITTYFALTALLLQGKTELAVAGYRELLAQPERWRATIDFSPSPQFWRRVLEYGAARISEQELLRAAQHSLWDQSVAHYLIAFNTLSQGDRIGAREHFQKCQDTQNFFAMEMWWSRAFLERMKNDAWPPWIPMKKNDSKP